MENESKDSVLYEERDNVAYVTINRPESFNAMNTDVRSRLAGIFQHVKGNSNARVVILTGQGTKAFSAGADLDELVVNLSTPHGARNGAVRGQVLLNTIENLGKPVIAAVNGYALGGGCELILACTIRISSTGAKFGLPEIKVGTLPGHGGIPRLVRLVGMDKAAELILTGDMIDASEAYRIGLVTRLAAPDQLMATCQNTANRIIENDEVAVQLGLEAIYRVSQMPLENALSLEAAFAALASCTQGSQQKIKALIEKRNKRR